MSNSFASPPQLTDPARTTAGLTIRSTEISRIANSQNYSFAVGGCHNVVSQSWAADVFRFDSTTKTRVCEWYIPRPSSAHNTLKCRINCFAQVTGSSVEVSFKVVPSGNVYSSSANITDFGGGRYNSSFLELTINITDSLTDEFCILGLDLTGSGSGYIEINEFQASWLALTSPLAAGVYQQGTTNEFIPQGQSRYGADLPLTSRFGVQTLDNITTMRRRGRVLLNWSASFASSSATSPAQGLGVAEQHLLYSMVALFAGMREEGLNVDIFIKVSGLGAGATLDFDIFGYRVELYQNSWNSFGLGLIVPEDLTMSDEFGLSMYRVGVDNTPHNQSVLLGTGNPITGSPAYIQAISVIGV